MKANGAGEGNRTLTVSLEGWNSTVELHPQIFELYLSINSHKMDKCAFFISKSFINFETSIRTLIGDVKIVYQNGCFELSGAMNETIKLEMISNPIITLRRDFAFVYNHKYYYIKLDKYIFERDAEYGRIIKLLF